MEAPGRDSTGWLCFLSYSTLRVKSEKQMKIMQVKASEMTACLVIVVPGGADHVKPWASSGF